VDTFAATRSSGPQDMPEMGDEWGKWMICTYDTTCISRALIDLICHLPLAAARLNSSLLICPLSENSY
jgi:hypothetical protein